MCRSLPGRTHPISFWRNGNKLSWRPKKKKRGSSLLYLASSIPMTPLKRCKIRKQMGRPCLEQFSLHGINLKCDCVNRWVAILMSSPFVSVKMSEQYVSVCRRRLWNFLCCLLLQFTLITLFHVTPISMVWSWILFRTWKNTNLKRWFDRHLLLIRPQFDFPLLIGELLTALS